MEQSRSGDSKGRGPAHFAVARAVQIGCRNSEHLVMAAAVADSWIEVPAHLRCRLLFGSPVCVLATRNASQAGSDIPGEGAVPVDAAPVHPFNAMTISWLTAIDNHRRFFLSVNAGRHSLVNLLRDGNFTLSVAVAGMEEALLSFGSQSGRTCQQCDCFATASGAPAPAAASGGPDTGEEPAVARSRCKFSSVLMHQPWVVPGSWTPWQGTAPAPQRPSTAALPAHGASPAHLVCRVVAVLSGAAAETSGAVAPTVSSSASPAAATPHSAGASTGGRPAGRSTGKPRPPQQIQHALLECEIDAAFVRRRYWHLGKIFGAEACAPHTPPPLAFAGTQRFALITLEPLDARSVGDAGAEAALSGSVAVGFSADGEGASDVTAAAGAGSKRHAERA